MRRVLLIAMMALGACSVWEDQRTAKREQAEREFHEAGMREFNQQLRANAGSTKHCKVIGHLEMDCRYENGFMERLALCYYQPALTTEQRPPVVIMPESWSCTVAITGGAQGNIGGPGPLPANWLMRTVVWPSTKWTVKSTDGSVPE
jgi:hypothetical protein